MKLSKSFWLRMLPVVIIVLVTLFMSITIYRGMIENERESCWERLEIATKSTADKITVRLTDNLNFLNGVSDSFVLTQHLDQKDEVGKYLTRIMEMTIFEKIDVIFPDGRILNQSGEIVEKNGEIAYEDLVKKGTHISPRMTDPFLGREVIYCFTPIGDENAPKALLCGTIDCQTMGEMFEVFTYAGESQLYLIDCGDGNYLIDNWHEKLGNLYEIGPREGIDGGEKIDIITPLINRENARISYVSNTNGENSYQYSAPVEGFNWVICVVVQEDVVFAHAQELEGMLFSAGVVVFILVLMYVFWNVWLSTVSVRNEEKMKKLELEKATNAAKAKFISNMSHDVRTPINGIVGMIRIIRNHRDEQEIVDDCIDKIEVSTNYLSTLASDMLDINEIESDKFILESVPFNLTQLAEDLSVVVEQKAKESHVVFHMDYSGIQNPYVLGSMVHIKRILVNLIGNAIKYNKSGGEVWVNIVEGEQIPGKEMSNYHFTVRDNGIGIAKEFQEDMYNAFAQEKMGARSSYQGYGLGLTIVHRLVEKMNGSIDLKSEKGEGSTFTVTIPLLLDAREKVQIIEETENIDLTGVKILVVEDNELNLEIAEVLLSDVGAEITSAVNGRLAVDAFAASEANFFDLILMDIMMPEMDGCEATQAIRALDRPDAKTIPIIAMTASAFTEEIQRCKEAGMNEHIAKPLDIDNLMLQVAKYCRKNS